MHRSCRRRLDAGRGVLRTWSVARLRHRRRVAGERVTGSATGIIERFPERLRPAAERLFARVARCAPATRASWRLFTQRIAEQVVRDPHAGPDDAAAARAVLDGLHAEGESQGLLFDD